MKKDIFIDNNIACRFSNPMDPEMKKLIAWIQKYNKDSDENAILVVSQKLLNEYLASCKGAYGKTSIPIILDQLTREGRLSKISNNEIKEFKARYFTKQVENRLRSNQEDRNHIPVALLSERKFVLTRDDKFAYDLLHFPGYKVHVCEKPQDMPYDK